MLREDAAEGEPGAACSRADTLGLGSFVARELLGDEAGLLLVLEPIALALDVDGGGVIEQPVKDGRGDDVVGEDGAPVTVALVRGCGVPGSFCTSEDETNWNKRSSIWHEGRSIRQSRS